MILKEGEGIIQGEFFVSVGQIYIGEGCLKLFLRDMSLNHGYIYLSGGALNSHENRKSKGDSEFV